MTEVKLIKTPRAAARVGMSTTKLRVLVASDPKFPKPKIVGPRIHLFDTFALDRWLADRGSHSAAGGSL